MFLAHISGDHSRNQSIEEHLHGTAELAGEFASFFHCREWGYGCGLVHDIGKYSENFQKRIRGGRLRADHSTAGAQELYKRKYIMAAYCVAGHHSGLPDGGTPGDSPGEPTLQGRMKKKVDAYEAYREDIVIPAFPNVPLKPLGAGGFSVSFFIRMLYSCLTDADCLDTEYFMEDGRVGRNSGETPERLLEKLEAHVKPWLQYNTDELTVNGRRTAILKACFEKGSQGQGVFQLTVPTGGGKTLSSLAFALRHAKEHHLSRVIYVIPYTSIIEQNAQVFRDILGNENVLEDHCNAVYEDEDEFYAAQLATENWDKPVVVTTNVQFFESLFANKKSKCRKLHNMANSVIIFDEAQMLPVNYLKPCVRAISELVHNYHSTAVLCTATQPSLKQFFPEQLTIREICPDVRAQYEFFKRTVIEKKGDMTEEELIRELKGHSQSLCILNSRKRVQRVYGALKEMDEEGTYHLSTLMYPVHRKRILKEVRERLKEGNQEGKHQDDRKENRTGNQIENKKEKPGCRLVATSLVEAGVDLDFEAVFRELAGVDSVIQAAGRCNREGSRRKEDCVTSVFTLPKEEGMGMPPGMRQPVIVAEQVAEKYEDLSSPEAISDYFDRLYHLKGDGVDSKDIIGQLEAGTRSFSYPFAAVAGQFKLIENDTRTILIAVEEEARKLAERIRRGEHSRQLVRDAGQYCINVYEKDFEKLSGAGCLEAVGLDMYVLRNSEMYTEDRGLVMDVERGDALFC